MTDRKIDTDTYSILICSEKLSFTILLQNSHPILDQDGKVCFCSPEAFSEERQPGLSDQFRSSIANICELIELLAFQYENFSSEPFFVAMLDDNGYFSIEYKVLKTLSANEMDCVFSILSE